MKNIVYVTSKEDEEQYKETLRVFKNYDDAKAYILEKANQEVDEETYMGELYEGERGCVVYVLYKDTGEDEFDMLLSDSIYLGDTVGDVIKSRYYVAKETVY